jgi:hypothetical protein
MTPLEMDEIRVAINQAISLLTLVAVVPQQLHTAVIALAVASFEHAASIPLMVWNAIDPSNPANKNRMIDCFSVEDMVVAVSWSDAKIECSCSSTFSRVRASRLALLGNRF